jgi:hypothetical protein
LKPVNEIQNKSDYQYQAILSHLKKDKINDNYNERQNQRQHQHQRQNQTSNVTNNNHRTGFPTKHGNPSTKGLHSANNEYPKPEVSSNSITRFERVLKKTGNNEPQTLAKKLKS